jgi:hypothetical protein
MYTRRANSYRPLCHQASCAQTSLATFQFVSDPHKPPGARQRSPRMVPRSDLLLQKGVEQRLAYMAWTSKPFPYGPHISAIIQISIAPSNLQCGVLAFKWRHRAWLAWQSLATPLCFLTRVRHARACVRPYSLAPSNLLGTQGRLLVVISNDRAVAIERSPWWAKLHHWERTSPGADMLDRGGVVPHLPRALAH